MTNYQELINKMEDDKAKLENAITVIKALSNGESAPIGKLYKTGQDCVFDYINKAQGLFSKADVWGFVRTKTSRLKKQSIHPLLQSLLKKGVIERNADGMFSRIG